MTDLFPLFHPHPLLRGGHLQTLAAYYFGGANLPYRAVQHHVPLDDGDTLVLHDDCPRNWTPGEPVALLLHGLAGCHRSAYMVRIAAKLNDVGVRAFRLDHRGCGAGSQLASQPYNAGRSDDARVALQELIRIAPGSPITLIGFSLSGNIVLKFLGEHPHDVPAPVVRAIVVNPAIDLSRCVAEMNRGWNRIYDRRFVKELDAEVRSGNRQLPESYTAPKTLWEFDDTYTAPASGFGTAENYYARCSANQFVGAIRVPTIVLTAADDPMVPVSTLEELDLPSSVRLHVASSGGHLGYIARRGADPDCRWLDWRVVDWVRAESILK